MIELTGSQLVIRLPEVHEAARLTIDFQRTLRIPDDDRAYRSPRAWASSRCDTWTTSRGRCRRRGSSTAA